MTGSHPQPAPHRETGTEDANDHLAIQAESRTSNFDLPALNSMRPTAPPSRPYGRYAVGLRPSLDPDACFDAPSQDNEARRTNQNNTEVGLDRPRSFRNELQAIASPLRSLRQSCPQQVSPGDVARLYDAMAS